MSKMKKAFLYGPRDLRIEEVEIPKITKDQVLIKIKACGICPTDIRIFNRFSYSSTKSKSPIQKKGLGHEWEGEIVEVGKNITKVKIGDRVAVDDKIPCGHCYFCRNGLDRRCPEIYSRGKKYVSGGHVQYGVAIEEAIFPIPSGVSDIEAAFTEPVSCCITAVENSNVRLGDDVLIAGGGPMGLINMQLCKIRGARTIISEPIEARRKKAKELGVDEVINPLEGDFVKKVKDLTNGRGAKAVIVAVGKRIVEMQALEAVRKNGTVVFFAGTWPEVKFEINPNFFHYNEVKLTGASNFNIAVFPRALKLMGSKMINLETLVSHRVSLDDLKEGFEIVEKQKALKVMDLPHL
jgi:L-iditol 2-dehydrogenase